MVLLPVEYGRRRSSFPEHVNRMKRIFRWRDDLKIIETAIGFIAVLVIDLHAIWNAFKES